MQLAHTVSSAALLAALLAATVVAFVHQRAWFRHVSTRGSTAFQPLVLRVVWSMIEANNAILRGFTGRGRAWPPREKPTPETSRDRVL